MAYDIIGDIHGQAGKLTNLLHRMGYRVNAGAWRHPGRTAIFVGDLIDRGPGQLETVDIVRRMIDAGCALAVMGNHEFNAIAWYLPDPLNAGEHLRRHTGNNFHQHSAFLRAVGKDRALHRNIVEWFKSLPLWLDLPNLRVVHACWHPGLISQLRPYLRPGNLVDDALVESASRKGSSQFQAIEGLTKGIEAALPAGIAFHDKDGHERRDVRVRWWETSEQRRTYRCAIWGSAQFRLTLPDTQLPAHACIGYPDDKPLFFGHYWQTGIHAPLTPYIACVDYSAGNGGPLVAYRWDGEPELDQTRFVSSGS